MDAPEIKNVCAVAVTYHPDLEALEALLDAIRPQTGRVVVVDNGSPALVVDWLRERNRAGELDLVSLGENLGIAAAHNRGIAEARRSGHSFVLLLDQDSIPESNMVARLLASYQRLSAAGEDVAAVGPRYLDGRMAEAAPFVQWGVFKHRHVGCGVHPSSRDIRTDLLISSGKLIPLAVLDRLGAMDEGLFIDNVDMEWCFRATATGYRLFGVCDAHMKHRLGDRVSTVWFLRTRRIIRHAPVRLYYMMRNRLLLYRRPYSPWRWISKDVLRMTLKLGLFSVLVPPRRENARMMLRGLWHGLRGRAGRYDRPHKVNSPHVHQRHDADKLAGTR